MEMIKFAVWGIGVRGKVLIRMLGERVSCIIERNEKLHSTCYRNIPIISLEKYLNLYSDCPIIITPMNYENAISSFLAGKKVEFVKYSSIAMLVEAFWAKTPIENSLKKYDKNQQIIIYGGDLLGYLLFDFLQEKKFVCKFAFQDEYQGNVLLRNSRVEWTREVVKDAQVILTLPLVGKDLLETEGLNRKFERYYETVKTRELYYDNQLEYFKNIHYGKRCFIVATGPSLKINDLDKLYQNRELCFSVNGIFPAFHKTKWRPDYYMVSDPEAVIRWKNEIIETELREKFIASRAWLFDDKEERGNMHLWHVFRIVEEGKKPQFSEDFARGTFTGMTIIYDGALQLAVYMGFTEIYLLGVDCNYAKGGRNNYFFNEQKKDMLNHHEEDMIRAYQAAKDYADAHDIKIYNATRGGMLEVFERINFDQLFEKSKE